MSAPSGQRPLIRSRGPDVHLGQVSRCLVDLFSPASSARRAHLLGANDGAQGDSQSVSSRILPSAVQASP